MSLPAPPLRVQPPMSCAVQFYWHGLQPGSAASAPPAHQHRRRRAGAPTTSFVLRIRPAATCDGSLTTHTIQVVAAPRRATSTTGAAAGSESSWRSATTPAPAADPVGMLGSHEPACTHTHTHTPPHPDVVYRTCNVSELCVTLCLVVGLCSAAAAAAATLLVVAAPPVRSSSSSTNHADPSNPRARRETLAQCGRGIQG